MTAIPAIPSPAIARGRLAMYLFLASEAMFFLGLFAAYVVLRAASPDLFAHHARQMPVLLPAINTAILLASSIAIGYAVRASCDGRRLRTVLMLSLTMAATLAFLGIKSVDYAQKLTHHTILTRDGDGGLMVIDGVVGNGDASGFEVVGHRMTLAADAPFDPHAISSADVAAAQRAQVGHADARPHPVVPGDVVADFTYGPRRNLFYANYFTLTGVHAAHLIGGLLPLGWLLFESLRGRLRPAQAEYTAMYWHFVDAVWIALFATLYLT